MIIQLNGLHVVASAGNACCAFWLRKTAIENPCDYETLTTSYLEDFDTIN